MSEWSKARASAPWLLRILVLGITLIGGACSGVAPGSDGSADLPPDVVPTFTSAAQLPYDRFTLGREDSEEFKSAFSQLVVKCAARYGSKLIRVVDSPEALGAEEALWGGRFGTLGLEQALRSGYRAEDGQPVTEPFTMFVREDEQPQLGVLRGEFGGTSTPRDDRGFAPPRGGCYGEVTELVGGNPTMVRPRDEEAIRLKAFRDRRVQDAMDGWSKCMNAKGYEFSAVDEPIDSVAGSPLSGSEKILAASDARCTRSSRWSDLVYALISRLQQAEADRDRSAFESRYRTELSWLKQARLLCAQQRGQCS